MALQESQRSEWNGDVQLDQQTLPTLRLEYDQRRCKLDQAAMCVNFEDLQHHLDILEDDFREDNNFLVEGHRKALVLYLSKADKPGTSQQKLMELNWNATEYFQLLGQVQDISRRLTAMRARPELPWDVMKDRLSNVIGVDYIAFLKGLFPALF